MGETEFVVPSPFDAPSICTCIAPTRTALPHVTPSRWGSAILQAKQPPPIARSIGFTSHHFWPPHVYIWQRVLAVQRVYPSDLQLISFHSSNPIAFRFKSPVSIMFFQRNIHESSPRRVEPRKSARQISEPNQVGEEAR